MDGVGYLHGHDPRIVHGDLKPGNVLIDDRGRPTICDFGLAQIFLEAGTTGVTTTSEHTGTARYLAPELVLSDHTVPPTKESDMYAVGCLGLEFIYLQKPYYNRVNNLRGQIFQDIRAGVPPAFEPPPQGWPSRRLWPLLQNLWNRDPFLRHSAFTAVHHLRRTTLTLPLTVIQRITRFVAVTQDHMSHPINKEDWIRRTSTLYSLCLVSRAYGTSATRPLYQTIRIYWESTPHQLQALLKSIEESESHSNLLGHTGKENMFEAIQVLCVVLPSLPVLFMDQRMSVSDFNDRVATTLYSLVSKIPRLRHVIVSDGEVEPVMYEVEFNTLSSLALQNLAFPHLLYRPKMLQILSYMRSLRIAQLWDADDIFELPPATERVLLPSLESITIYLDNLMTGSNTWKLFTQFSTWVMPTFWYLDIRVGLPLTRIPLEMDSFLGTHGHQIQHLTWLVKDLNEISLWNTLLLRIMNLRSFSTHLIPVEKLRVVPVRANLERLNIYVGDMVLVMSARSLSKQLSNYKAIALSKFPRLIDGEFRYASSTFDLSASFRTQDRFTKYTIRDSSWRVYDDGLEVRGTVWGEGDHAL